MTHDTTAAPDRNDTTATPDRTALDVAVAVVAALLHVAALWLVSVSGLMAPGWAILLGLGLWLGATVVVVRALRARARWAPLVPLALLAAWAGVLSLGGSVLGWTA